MSYEMTMKNLIEELSPSMTFKNEDEKKDLLSQLTEEDEWIRVKPRKMKMIYHPAGDEIPAYLQFHPDKAESLHDQSHFELCADGCSYYVNNIAFFTLLDRIGLKCRLVNERLSGGSDTELQEVCTLFNLGCEFSREDDEIKVLLRAGQIMAAHSNSYVPLPQEDLFTAIEAGLKERFPKLAFEKVSYTHSRTSILYQLADGADLIMSQYVKVWSDAGLSESAAKASKIYLEVATSDTAEHAVSMTAYLSIRHMMYRIGEIITQKHNGVASISGIKSKVAGIYANVNKNIDAVATLIQTPIANPAAAMVRAAYAVGLDKSCKKTIRNVISQYVLAHPVPEETNAFCLYSELNDLCYTEEYEKLSLNAKLQTQEKIYRLTLLDWKKLDRPGVEEV